MKKIIKIFILIVIVVAVTVGGVRLLKMRKAEVSNLPTPEKPVYTVKGTTIKKGVVVEEVAFLGKIIPYNKSIVASKFSGNIQSVKVEEGEKVKKGQLLIEIDSSPVLLAIENLKINKESLKNQLESLKSELKSAQANYKFIKINFERDKKLYKGKAISEIQFLQSKTQLETAKAKVDAVESNIKSLEDKIASIDKQIEIKKNDLKYLKIYSNVNGVVDKIFLREGSLAVPGKPILNIQSNLQKIVVNFPIKYLDKIKKGTPVKINFNGTIEKSKVNQIYPSGNNSLSVAEILINKIPSNFPSNMNVNLTFEIKRVEGLVVPKEAVLKLTNGTFLITQKDGKFLKIPVKVLATDEKKAVIQGNVKEGTPVAVAVENKLRLLSVGKKGKIVIQKLN